MTLDEYEKIDAVNQSRLWLMRKSPYHFKNCYFKESKSKENGTLIHTAILEPHKALDTFRVVPEFCYERREKDKIVDASFAAKEGFERVKLKLQSNAHKRIHTEFCSDSHKTYITQDQMQLVVGLSRSANSQSLAEYFAGTKESFGVSTVFGTNAKGIADVLGDDFITDLKTTTDASPAGFKRSVYNYGYYFQAAFYCELFNRRDFTFVAIETEAPYAVCVHKMSDEYLDYGYKQVERLLKIYNQCRQQDVWPSYASSVLHLPTWVEEGA